MKITVKVDVQEVLDELFEDFNPEYDTMEFDLKDGIKDSIIGDTKRQLITFYGNEFKQQIQSQVKTLVTEEISTTIEKSVKDFAKNGKIESRYGSDEPMSLQEWVRKVFSETGGRRDDLMIKAVKQDAERCVKEVKSRYDMLFASQVISGLKQQNMLKDGVFEALMKESK